MSTPPEPPEYGSQISEALFLDLVVRLSILLGLFFLLIVALILFGLTQAGQEIVGYAFGLVMVTVLAVRKGARYLCIFYELSSTRLALTYLMANCLSIGKPTVFIQKGKKLVFPRQSDYTQPLGGPFKLLIMPDSVVLLEAIDGSYRVLEAGNYKISRFETIKEVISLEEYHEELSDIEAVTQDGIKVKVSGGRVRFRLACTSTAEDDCLNKAYPVDPEAAANMVYNRSQGDPDLTPWERAVAFTIRSSITDYINHHTLDDLIASGDLDGGPRVDISNHLHSESVRRNLRQVGAELVWWDVGHFDVPADDVKKQRVGAWQAHVSGEAEMARAEGEARRQSNRELGRAEAQAEIFMSIVNALNDINAEPGSRQNIRNLMLLRTAQLLETMGELKSADSKVNGQEPAEGTR